MKPTLFRRAWLCDGTEIFSVMTHFCRNDQNIGGYARLARRDQCVPDWLDVTMVGMAQTPSHMKNETVSALCRA